MARKIQQHLIRTRLAKQIIAEVAMPERQSGKVAIVVSGLPTTPPRRDVLDFLATKGYVVFSIRYRGTWESEGYFLQKSPKQDVKDAIDDIVKSKSFLNLETREKVKIQVRRIHLFGGSFGGPAVLLNSAHKSVDKAVAIAPVIDWQGLGPAEPFNFFVRFTQDGYGDAYRLKQQSDWQKLLQPNFYNPVTDTQFIDPKKCFIIHNKDDVNILFKPVEEFVEKHAIEHYFKPRGGHIGTSSLPRLFFWHKIERFLRSKN